MIDCSFQQTGGSRVQLDCSPPISDFGIMDTIYFYGKWALLGLIVIFLVCSFVKIAREWDRAVILRLGRYQRVSGPGLFFKIPFVETIADWTSLQVEVTQIKAEKTLTKDTVPVNVQTVMFWKVVDPKMAVIEVDDYRYSLNLASQTALREAIGSHDFTELLTQRESVDKALLASIEAKAKAWGLLVQSIEIQDVEIPADLQDAMSREAQAEREQHARVILGESEIAIAEKFVKAAEAYKGDPIALQLRQMNIIYETTKERGSTILLPTSMLDALGGIMKRG